MYTKAVGLWGLRPRIKNSRVNYAPGAVPLEPLLAGAHPLSALDLLLAVLPTITLMVTGALLVQPFALDALTVVEMVERPADAPFLVAKQPLVARMQIALWPVRAGDFRNHKLNTVVLVDCETVFADAGPVSAIRVDSAALFVFFRSFRAGRILTLRRSGTSESASSSRSCWAHFFEL
jgi:hypothetical protein